MRKPLSIGLAAAVAMIALGACSNSLGGHTAASPGAASSAPARAAEGVAGVGAAPGAAAGRTTVDDAPTLSPAKIRTAEITVAVRGAAHVATRADQAEAIATRAGGEIDSDDRVSGHDAEATLRLRVPPDQLEPVLRALSALGTETSRSSSATDVTERVADVTSRLASARDSIARLRALYRTATRVPDVIAIETELSSREADLESLEAQQRSLARETAMASVTLHLQTAAKHATHPAKRSGFLGGLQRGWDGFVSAAAWVATAAGTVLPFLALLAALALARRLLGVHRRGQRQPQPTTTGE